MTQTIEQPTVPVYEWLDVEGAVIGCGTGVEFEQAQTESAILIPTYLGKILTHEPASLDAARLDAWGVE